jgi:hypothetical protein
MSTRLGESVEFLSEMSFLAERSGVRVTGMQIAIQRANRRIAEFATLGKGVAAGAIKTLGLEVRNTDGSIKSFEQILPELVRSLADVEDQSEKVRLAFQLFDSEGVAFLQIANQGETAIRGMRTEFKELRGVITEEFAKDAERFNDALTNMATAGSSVLRLFLKPALTQIEGVSKAVTTISNAIHDLAETRGMEALGTFFKNFVTGTPVKGLMDAQKILSGSRVDLKGAADEAEKLVDQLGQQLVPVTRDWKEDLSAIGHDIIVRFPEAAELFLSHNESILKNERERLAIYKMHTRSLREAQAALEEKKQKAEQIKRLQEQELAKYNEMGAAIRDQVVAGLSDALFRAQDLGDVIKGIVVSLLQIGLNLAARSVLPFNQGGVVPTYADGGKVEGFPTGGLITRGRSVNAGRDNRLIAAQTGEGILTRDAVARLGEQTLNALNAGGGAGGVTIENHFHNSVVDGRFAQRTLIPMLRKQVVHGQADIPASRVVRQGQK